MNSSIQFWNRTAQRYAQREIADPEAYQKKLSITQRYLGPHMRVMEFGCGTGTTALVHAPKVRSYLATDASPKMIDIARQRINGNDASNLRFEVGTLTDLRDKGPEFDAILGLNILHLLKEPRFAIQHVFDLLKPGGIFVTSTACLKDHRYLFKPLATIAHFLNVTPYVNFISRKELEGDLESTGFHIEFRWVPESTKDVYFLIATKEK